ncbi:PAS domain S-box-containing protein/diguanylate cyclase (GGDEF)-like protein [Methylobacter tundripaludum]|uniref:PAS domain S-box-containing protein/diguanylate cyclase (GGDEF)-like protein n=1 Tax=Methylobacter tundripaludum TaxID=173365 RepID=A0A2S6HJ31_9GAMM|nr:diguanylate cyclase [Methylobacter tundripaludum]PPK77403.1 PAS domain S-box-containing protein/diguanylate cyclase (GGDEF)-like protein [Methylobacter tundripaludum]
MSRGQAIRVLLVEDEDGDAHLVKMKLGQTQSGHFEVTWTQSLADAQRCLAASSFDVILLDLSLPDSEGLATVHSARVMAIDMPIVVLSGRGDTDFALTTLEAGAVDYMVKGDYGYDGLARVIRYALLRTEMEARNNLLIAALEAAANGVVITDKDATVIWANSAFGRLTGYSPEEAVGNNPNQLTKSGLQNADFYKDMWAVLLDGQNWRGELVNKRKNGSLYHEELSIAPVKNGTGEITHFVGIKEDITERKEMEAQLQKLASTDPLTGLFNRRVFLEKLELERAKVARLPHYSAVLLMLDLDFFKRVNDAYGHATGDIVLKVFAEIARNTSRAIDIAARLGGEEFAILLSGADKNDALIMAERLREQVAKTVIDHDAGPVQITVSIGAATLSGDDMNGEAVLHRADVALYEAKDRGRNQTCWFGF